MDPLARFGALVTGPEADLPLDVATLLVATDAHPDLDVDARLVQLDELARAAVAEGVTDADGLAGYLFKTGGFQGNTDDYGDPRNSYFDDVLDRRTGLPITLAVVMIEVGRRCGVALHGVGMPGHFLVGANLDSGGREFFDAFAGGTRLDVDACRARFADMYPDAVFDPSMLAVVGPRAILDRILTNLQLALLSRDPPAARWPVRLRLRIPGASPRTRAELATVLGSLGATREAATILEEVAGLLPDAAARRVRTASARLRARDN